MPPGLHGARMNLKVFTLVFDAEAQAFDDAELLAFQAEHEVVGLYEHFFVHHGTRTGSPGRISG